MGWAKSVATWFAEGFLKSKLAELEKRLLEMEKHHEVFSKSIKDAEEKNRELDRRLFETTKDASVAKGAISAIFELNGIKMPLIETKKKSR